MGPGLRRDDEARALLNHAILPVPLWDSYNFAIALVSKTYARGGISTRSKVPAAAAKMYLVSFPPNAAGPEKQLRRP